MKEDDDDDDDEDDQWGFGCSAMSPMDPGKHLC